ncbi:MAG TPA: hypothetical protein VF641_07715, partial [Methylobacterium sp.]
EGLMIASVVIAAGTVCLSPVPPPLKAVFAAPLVLLLPGLAVMKAASLDGRARLESLALATGLSMALAVVAGLLLHLLDRLTPAGWVVSLGGLTLAACAIIVTAARSTEGPASDGRLRLGRRQGLMVLGSVLLVVAAVALARNGALAHRQYTYTEFWMVPTDSTTRLVTIGIRNAELVPTAYDVDVLADDAIVGRWPSILVPVGETRSSAMTLATTAKAPRRIEARLYRTADRGRVYRKVWVAVPALPGMIPCVAGPDVKAGAACRSVSPDAEAAPEGASARR